MVLFATPLAAFFRLFAFPPERQIFPLNASGAPMYRASRPVKLAQRLDQGERRFRLRNDSRTAVDPITSDEGPFAIIRPLLMTTYLLPQVENTVLA